MSTKVYVAYKIKPHVVRDQAKFWQWVRDTQRRAEGNIKKVLRDVYSRLIKHINKETDEEYLNLVNKYGYSEESACLSAAQRFLVKQVKENAGSHQRSMFDFDVSIAIREHKGNLYLVPHCDMLCRDVLNFLKQDPRLVDFEYWNNTDPPYKFRSKKGYRQWQARGRVWDEIDKNIGEYLLINVCDFSKFVYLDPWLELATAQAKRNKRLGVKKINDAASSDTNGGDARSDAEESPSGGHEGDQGVTSHSAGHADS